MRHKASVSKTERKSFNEPSLDWAHIVLYASGTTTTTAETGSNSNCNNNESCQQIARKSHKPFTTTTAQRNAASSMMPSVLNVLIALIDIVVDVLPPATITKRFLCTTALLFIPLDWLRCAPPPPPPNSFCLGVRQGVLILFLPLPPPASKADKAKTASIV